MSPKRPARKKMKRRSFLDYLLGTSFAITGFGILGAIVRFIWPPHRVVGIQYTDRMLATTLDELKEGMAVRKIFNGRGVLIVRTASGITAVDIKCTHLKCNVRWDPERKIFVCPCHNGLFDQYGNVIAGPPPRPLRRVGVRVMGNAVYLVSREG
jgi:Rieske Fe-S protein